MNILIADEDKVGRKVLKYVLNKFDNVSVNETNTYKDTKDILKNKKIDILFISALLNTEAIIKEISENNKNCFVVIISNLMDNNIVHTLLKAGAKDYILKPFNTSILKNRIKNYFKIVNSAKLIGFDNNQINAFEKACSPHYSVFKISKEHDLTHFWEYMMIMGMHLHAEHDNQTINSAVDIVFNIGLNLVKKGECFAIFVEKDKESYYFTIADLPQDSRESVLNFIAEKVDLENSVIKYTTKSLSLSIQAKFINNITQEVTYHYDDIQRKNLQTYDFIDSDDLADLDEYLNELESFLCILQYSKLSNNDTLMITKTFERISSVLSNYNETYNISIAIKSLSQSILSSMEEFILKSKEVAAILMSFCQDLKDWRNALFITGAPSFYFMDATIITNSSYIASFLNPSKPSDSSIDDIFEFAS